MTTQHSTSRDFEKELSVEPTDQLSSAQKDSNGDLPCPVSAQSPRPKPKISAAAIIPVWIVLSSAVILYNNHLYSTLNFRFPVFLVTWHLTFAVSPAPRCSKCVLFAIGHGHPRFTTHYPSPRWSEGHPYLQGYVPPLYPPYRPIIQREFDPE